MYDFNETQKGTPFLLPWKERKAIDVANFASHVRDWCEVLSVQGISTARDVGYISICGASGVGKTRTGMQLPKLLKDSLPGCHVIQTFCHADRMEQMLFDRPMLLEFHRPDDGQGSQAEAGRWLSRQLMSFYHPTTQWADLPLPNLTDILRKIRSMHSVPVNDSLVIFFQIDEFQHRLERCTHLLRYLGSLICATGSQSPFKATNTLLVPVFTGTWLGQLTLATEMINLEISLVGLDSPEDAHGLFSDYLKDVEPALIPRIDNYFHRHVLTMLGYVPNMIVTYARVFKAHPCDLANQEDYKGMWGRLELMIQPTYNAMDLKDEHKKHLLCLWYFSTPVTPSYDLGNGYTIQRLMSSGVLFLTPGEADFTVAVPLVIARIWSPHFHGNSFIDPRAQLTEAGFPKFILKIHQLTYRMMGLQADLYAQLGNRAAFKRERRTNSQGKVEVLTSLSEIYNHAIEGPKAILDRDLWIQPDIKELSKQKGNPAVYGLYETPDRSAGADAITPHAAEQYKSSMTFSQQGKVIAGGKLTGSNVIRELNKTFYGRDLLAIITPKTIKKIKVVGECFEIQHGGHVKLAGSKSFPRLTSPVSSTDSSAAMSSSPASCNSSAPRTKYLPRTTSFSDCLLLLHTEEKLKQFTRSLLSFASADSLIKANKSMITKNDGTQSEVMVTPRSKKRKAPNPRPDSELEDPAAKKKAE